MLLLKVSNLTKRFGGLTAVSDVSVEIESTDEILGIIGPNGAGKTTFFNLITGVFPQTSGEIHFDNTLLNGKTPDQISKLGISRTFQNIRLFNKLTVIENVMVSFFAHSKGNWITDMFKGRNKNDDAKREAKELLRFVGITEDKFFTISSHLSYGDQRRLEIARALASNPKLLFLDEPAAGMNSAETQSLIELIRNINEKGVAVVLIEHDMKLVMEVCERIIVLNYGSKLAEGEPEEIRNNEKVIQAYLGQGAN